MEHIESFIWTAIVVLSLHIQTVFRETMSSALLNCLNSNILKFVSVFHKKQNIQKKHETVG